MLQKAAYGLRDAPLLWHLKACEVLRENRYKATLHDACTFVLREEGSHKLVAILTVHVDDLLVAAMPKQIKALETFLSAAFGNLTLDNAVKGFRHFGVDLTYDQKMRKITSSQLHYVNDLTLIETPKRVNKTLPCPPEIVTQYRASVSAVAWVGVTSPWALASASMLQGCLPTPTWNDVYRLNANILQLKQTYKPLQYTYLEPPLRLINIADSSFANTGGKYSQGGFMILLTSEKDNHVAVSYTHLTLPTNREV